jgi:CubicO group peptidase (beta-lactamase class C family)
LLSAILTRVTGKKAAVFADETLFKSLGIWREKDARFAWKNDAGGAHVWHEDGFWDEQDGFPWKVDLQAAHNTGGFGAHFTAREMAKLCYLYLNKGYWDGEQLISEEYVRTSTCKQSEGGWPLYFPYGYLWWLPHFNGYEAFLASGFGSKLIYVVPALDLVIVTIASTEKALKDPTQNETILNLIPNFILPAIIKRE